MKIQATQQTKPSIAKKAVATVATAAVATGVALYLAKTGKLDKFVGKNAKVDSAIDRMKGVADKIANTNTFKKAEGASKKVVDTVFGKLKSVSDSVRARLGKFNPDIAPAAEKAAETFNNFVK